MAIGTLGVDSLSPVTSATVATAGAVLKTPPKFWGRYFSHAGIPAGQYQNAVEGPPLKANGIRVLPYARQTSNVGGTKAQGQQDGANNANAFFQEFKSALPQGPSGPYFMFLDVEPSTPLSSGYYDGWSSGLISRMEELTNGTVKMAPGVYLNSSDNKTCAALNAAVAAGAPCAGVVVARYFSPKKTNYPGPFDWDPVFFKPSTALTLPIVAWQFVGDFKNLDACQVDPDIPEATFLAQLVLPA